MGQAFLKARLPPAAAALLLAWLNGSPSLSAGLDGPGRSDLRRAFLVASMSTSEEPAVRAERRLREPSAGFMLGAALGAWTAAAAQLDFDLRAPNAAGSPHASQSGDNDDALQQDCAEEKTAFTRLDARAAGLDLDPKSVLRLAAVSIAAEILPRWLARRAGPADACR
jgi:hypothetical protein